MNAWLWAAFVFSCLQAPLLWVCTRARAMGALVALQLSSVVVVMTLLALAEGTGRAPFYDLVLTLALLTLPSGLVFARFLERWD